MNARPLDKVVTARSPKRLAQLRSVSYALVSNLQKHRPKTSNVIRFGSLHFRDNWGWLCTAVRMQLICSNGSLSQNNIFLLPGQCDTIHNHLFCDRLSDHLQQIVQSLTYWGRRSKRTSFWRKCP